MVIESILADNGEDNEDNEDNDEDDDDDDDHNNNNNNNSNSNSNVRNNRNDASTPNKPSWVDSFVDQPYGERGCTTKGQRVGWKKQEVLDVTGITEAQYTRYMVSFSIILAAGFTDSISSRNRHTGSASVTLTSQRAFVKTTGLIQLGILSLSRLYMYISLVLSPFADCGQMKDLHPRFRWHTDNWLTHHFVLNHCRVKSRAFGKLADDPDPDVEIYEDYLMMKKQNKMKEGHQAAKKRRFDSPRRSQPKVSVSALRSPQPDIFQALHKPNKVKSAMLQDDAAVPSASRMQETRKTSAADQVSSSIYIDLPSC